MELKAERDRFVAFAFAGGDVLVECDRGGRIRFATGDVQRRLGRPATELIGTSLLDRLVERDRPLLRQVILRAATGRKGPLSMRLMSGEPVLISALAVLDGTIHLTISTHGRTVGPTPADAIDPTSGLLNATSLYELVEQSVQDVERGAPAAQLILIFLKGLNDVGADDAVAIDPTFAAALRALSLGGDGAAELGPRRFGLLCSAETSLREVEEQLGSILDATAIGPRPTIETRLLLVADGALAPHEARQALRFVITDLAERLDGAELPDRLSGAFLASLNATKDRILAFRTMIARNEFRVVYQPVVGLDDRLVRHHEALSRFAGDRCPADVIRFAEDLGLIAEFDLAVCDRAAQELARSGTRSKLAVNLSARSLETDGFVERLIRKLGGLGRLGKRLMFEITESYAVTDLVRLDRVLQDLRRNGNIVCLDDFGAGATAFHYIRSLKVDLVKIDGSYVRQILSGHRDAAIVRAIVELCRALSIETVAEMIETEAQAATITDMGVDLGQGWLFGHPAERLGAAPGSCTAVECVDGLDGWGLDGMARRPVGRPFNGVS